MRKAFLAVAMMFAFMLSQMGMAHAAREKVILDTDMVEMFDDGVAMIMLANAPNIDLLGVTCVTGNSWIEEGVAYAIRQLEIEKKGSIPVAIGFDVPLRPDRHANFELERSLYGMGHDSWLGSFGRKRPATWQSFYESYYGEKPTLKPIGKHAVQFIIDTVRANPYEVTIAAIGPCTNLAIALRMAPDIAPLIKRVVYMGGAFYQPGNTSPTAEFNWWMDPEAAQIALRTPFKEQIIFGLDVCEKVVFRRSHYERLAKTIKGSPELDMLAKTFVGTMFSKPATDPDFTHFVWDVLVAAYIIDPTIMTKYRDALVDVCTDWGLSYGQSVAYPKNAPSGTRRARVVLDVNHEKFWNMVNDLTYWGGKKAENEKK